MGLPSFTSRSTAGAPISPEVFDETYYARHSGPLPLSRDVPDQMARAQRIAEHVASTVRPGRVFDAGCAFGLLVEALWAKGITAQGRDLSPYALSQAATHVRPFLELGSITEPVSGSFDLVLALDVLHHLEEPEVLLALQALAAAAPQLLVCVPSEPGDPRFCRTIRPLRWWLEQLAALHLAPVPRFDASCVAPNAFLVEHATNAPDARLLEAFEGLLRERITAARAQDTLQSTREEHATTRTELTQQRATTEALKAELARVRQEMEQAQRVSLVNEERALAQLHDLHQELGRTYRQLEEQARALAYRQDIETLTQQLEAQTEALTAVTRHRDLVLSSTSWKLTAPLRKVLATLRRNGRSARP